MLSSAAVHYETREERYAASAWSRLELSPPADLQSVSARLNVRVVRRSMSPLVIAAYLVTPKGRAVIVLQELLPLERQRYGWAHELGHVVLRKAGEVGPICVLGLDFPGRNTTLERRCDTFAACLLMPAELVIERFHELASNPTARLYNLAARFGVSKQAMKIRLRELRLE